jgi:hypothetical protein
MPMSDLHNSKIQIEFYTAGPLKKSYMTYFNIKETSFCHHPVFF